MGDAYRDLKPASEQQKNISEKTGDKPVSGQAERPNEKINRIKDDIVKKYDKFVGWLKDNEDQD